MISDEYIAQLYPQLGLHIPAILIFLLLYHFIALYWRYASQVQNPLKISISLSYQDLISGQYYQIISDLPTCHFGQYAIYMPLWHIWSNDVVITTHVHLSTTVRWHRLITSSLHHVFHYYILTVSYYATMYIVRYRGYPRTEYIWEHPQIYKLALAPSRTTINQHPLPTHSTTLIRS